MGWGGSDAAGGTTIAEAGAVDDDAGQPTATLSGNGPRSGVGGLRPDWRRVVQAVVLAAPSLILLERAWSRRWMTDDGFINLRVARMILEGHGPVFNVGERLEATTSPLWVWLIAAGDLVSPFRLEWVAILLGIACAVGGLGLATFGAARLHRAREGAVLLVPLGALVVAAVTPFWDYATSGLEGGLTFGWLGLTGWLVCRWAGAGARFGSLAAAAVGIGPLVRPDLALVPAVVLSGVLLAQWPDDRARDRLRLLGAALALPVAYQVFRMGYYATLVPNTALVKEGSRSRWDVGYAYLRDVVQPYWLVVPLTCLLVLVLVPLVVRSWRASDRRAVVALTALPAAGLLDGLYAVRVGGDYMHARLLLPALFALVVPVAAIPLPSGDDVRRFSGARGRALAAGTGVAVVVVWAAVALVQLHPGARPVPPLMWSSDAHTGHVRTFGEHAVTAADHGWGPGSPNVMLDPDVLVYVDGGPLDVTSPRRDGRQIFAAYGIGVGYALGSDVYILDLLGLADPLGSRFELAQPGITAHEKPLPFPWLAARVATGPVDPDQYSPPWLAIPLYESPPGEFDRDLEAARRALQCGDLADLDAAVRDPLTVGRFLSNLVDAPRYTRLRVPPDPVEAEERFCG